MTRPRAYAGLPLGWAAVVLILTLMPAQEMPVVPEWKLLSFYTAAHAGVFLLLAALSWFSLQRQRRWPRLAHHAGLIVLIGSILFGGLIEALQYAMGLGRHADWTDLLSDALGAALAVGVATAWAAWRGHLGRPLFSVFWVGLLLATALSCAVPMPTRAQDLFRVRRTIEKLASPGLHGRGYVRQGEHQAAAYLRGRFRALGLQPLAPDYTQPFTLAVNTFPGKLGLRVYSSVNSTIPSLNLRPGIDFIAAPGSAATVRQSYTLTKPDTLVLANRGLGGAALLNRSASDSPRSVLALVIHQRTEAQLHLPENADLLRQWEALYQARIVLVNKLTASVSSQQGKQPHLEILAARWPAVANGRSAYNAVELQIDAQLERSYQTQNLAAFVRGTAQPDSFLVIAAHYDHLGMMGRKTYFPGANDNASGVALLLELAAHYSRPENRPMCSVAFLLFGAEEAGLIGSSYFVAHPLVPLKNIRFLVNLDLLGTGEQGATVVNGRVLDGHYRRLVALNEAHQYLPQLAPRGRAANSDHYPFSEAGVRAFFIYTRGGSAAYHDVDDRPETLSLAGFAGAFGLVRDFLNELGAAPK